MERHPLVPINAGETGVLAGADLDPLDDVLHLCLCTRRTTDTTI